jgi:hypothetical protein
MRKHLTYANVTATLALVFAMSGGALAANSYLINSTKQINPKVLKKLTGKPGKNGTAGANGTTGATGATGAQGPGGKEGPPGKEGKEATDASNSLALGGIPASEYTLNNCSSLTGQVKGFAAIQASSSFSSTLTPVGGYNCSGGKIEARRIAEGVYEVKYVGSPVEGAVGNAINGFADTVAFTVLSPGDFEVKTYNAPNKALVDSPFFMVSP